MLWGWKPFRFAIPGPWKHTSTGPARMLSTRSDSGARRPSCWPPAFPACMAAYFRETSMARTNTVPCRPPMRTQSNPAPVAIRPRFLQTTPSLALQRPTTQHAKTRLPSKQLIPPTRCIMSPDSQQTSVTAAPVVFFCHATSLRHLLHNLEPHPSLCSRLQTAVH